MLYITVTSETDVTLAMHAINHYFRHGIKSKDTEAA